MRKILRERQVYVPYITIIKTEENDINNLRKFRKQTMGTLHLSGEWYLANCKVHITMGTKYFNLSPWWIRVIKYTI